LLQHVAAFNHFALVRSPGADAAAERTPLKIGFRLFFRNLLDRSFNAHLPLHRQPVSDQTGTRILREIFRFAASVIGKENKAAVVEIFQQDDPRRRLPIRRRSGQRHRVGLGNAGSCGFAVPFRELLNGVAVDI